MAQLSTIVGSILHDFVRAQHEANCYSLSLAQEYGRNGKIKDFRLPNALLGDLEFELSYAILGEGETRDVYEIDYPCFRRFFRPVSEQLAKTTITSVVSTVTQASIGADDGYDTYHRFMKKEETLKNEFCAFLGRKIFGALMERTADMITSDGDIDRSVLLETVVEVVRSEFLQHPDLDELFTGRQGEQLRSESEDNLKYSLSGLLSKLLNDFNCTRKHSFPAVEVTVKAEELQKLPEEAIQNIRFRITQREMEDELKGKDRD